MVDKSDIVIRHPFLLPACGKLLNHQIWSFLHKLINFYFSVTFYFIFVFISFNFHVCIKEILTHKSKITEGFILKNCPCPTLSHPQSTFQRNTFNSYDFFLVVTYLHLKKIWLIAIFWFICFRHGQLPFKTHENVAYTCHSYIPSLILFKGLFHIFNSLNIYLCSFYIFISLFLGSTIDSVSGLLTLYDEDLSDMSIPLNAPGFFHSVQCFWDSSALLCVSVLSSFLFIAENDSIV